PRSGPSRARGAGRSSRPHRRAARGAAPRARVPARDRCRSAGGLPSPASVLRGSSRSRRVVRGGSSSRRYGNGAMELGLSEKVCVVTGSTSGIGLAVAQQLRAEGARVVTSGRRSDGIGDIHVAADLTHVGVAEELVGAATAAFGRVDCLVNNVGGTNIRNLDELTDDDWQASFEL